MSNGDSTNGFNANSEGHQELNKFWNTVTEDIQNTTTNDFKTQDLPLARIKKIMKLDEDVKMISAEAPMLFSKAAEIFIKELTLRAWIHTEDNKRRTLQRNDIAMAITRFDQFDFLIDIVPREEVKPVKRPNEEKPASVASDQVQYYFQLAQQHQAALQQQPAAPTQIQIVQPGGQIQTIPIQNLISQGTTIQVASDAHQQNGTQQGQQQVQTTQPQIIQIQQPTVQASSQPQGLQLPQGGIQILQQIGANGEIQSIPIQLTHNQLQNMIRMQVQGQNQPQSIIIQSPQQPAVRQTQGGPQVTYQIQQLTTSGANAAPNQCITTVSNSQPTQTVYLTQGGQAVQVQSVTLPQATKNEASNDS